MNILFITSFSLKMNTSATIQNLIIINGLKQLGYNIDVITSKLNKEHVAYDDTLSLENINNYLELELPNALEIFQSSKKQNIVITKIKRILRRVYSEFEMYDGYKYLLNQIDTLNLSKCCYDFIISTSDPKSSHLLAEKIIEKFSLHQAKWIQYWGDPMYLDITRKRKFLDFRVKNAESKILKKADKIIYATPFTLKEQKEIYQKYAFKMDYIVQGYWYGYLNVKNIRNEKFTIGYFGNYSESIRNIIPLYKAVNKLNSIKLYIGGSGRKLNSTKNIEILGFLKHQDIKNYEQKCDVLVCILNNKGTQIPGKIYYYTSFNKPILIILDGEIKGEMKNFLKKFNRFDFCENNETEIRMKLEDLTKTNTTPIIPNELHPINIARGIISF